MNPDEESIVQALQSLISTPWGEHYAVLEREQDLLLTDHADQLLTRVITELKQNPDPQKQQSLRYLELHQLLLLAARRLGVAAARREFEESLSYTQQHPESVFEPDADTVAVERAFMALADAPSVGGLAEMYSVLEREKSLLLTDTAYQLLTIRLRRMRQSDPPNFQEIEIVERTLRLLTRGRAAGIPTAWAEFVAEVGQNDYETMTNAVSAFLFAPEEEQFSLLQRYQSLLLSDTAINMLASMSEHYEASDDTEDRVFAFLCLSYRELFLSARKEGIGRAWALFRMAWQDTISSSEVEPTIRRLINDWLGQPTQRDQRRFLETHPEILDIADETLLKILNAHSEVLAAQLQDLGDDIATLLKALWAKRADALPLVHEARKRGGTTEAIRTAYVNQFGGFTLEVPAWLAEVESQIEGLNKRNLSSHLTAIERLPLLRDAAQRAEADSTVAPEVRAELYSLFGDACFDYPLEAVQRKNLATDLYSHALDIYTFEQYPCCFAHCWSAIGLINSNPTIYANPFEPEKDEVQLNIYNAIISFQETLRVYHPDTFPGDYAAAQEHLGACYDRLYRLDPEKHRADFEKAVQFYQEALHIYTLTDFPGRHCFVQLGLASLFMEEAKTYQNNDARSSAYARAHTAFAAAREVYAQYTWINAFSRHHTDVEGWNVQEMYRNDAWCLWQMGDLQGAAVALESGRAEALTKFQALFSTQLEGLCPEHSVIFTQACQQWQQGIAQGDAKATKAARNTLLAARQAIRTHCRPDFLSGEPTYQEIAEAAAPDQALVYLAATDEGGMALVVPPRRSAIQSMPHIIPLPKLTRMRVRDYFVRYDGGLEFAGGLQFVFEHSGMSLFRKFDRKAAQSRNDIWMSSAIPSSLQRTTLQDLPAAILASQPTLRKAVKDMVAAWRAEADQLAQGDTAQQARAKDIYTWLAMPFTALLADADLSIEFENELGWWLQRAELEHVLQEMTFMEELRIGLDASGLGAPDQPIALIPCGDLGVLPLHAAPVRGNTVPFAETCELTYQPNARALAAAISAVADLSPGGPLVAVGDPQPTSLMELPYAEAEAEAIVYLAEQAKRAGSQAIIGAMATLPRVRKMLETIHARRSGAWVQIASHGAASVIDPHECYMLLAHNERLALEELQRGQLLAGTRGFTASGCVTGLGDYKRASDELGSFAAGLLQAGAPCVVATLWSVSDRATFLFMLRFHQVLLGGGAMTPARALREASRWTRQATRAELDELAKQGLAGVQPLEPEKLRRDAIRGIVLKEDETTRLSAQDAIKRLRYRNWRSFETEKPYSHPIYWAAAVVYGA